ncbi:aldehyde dehydrogenase family protein [Amycolatopsis sp. H20-H5]|uniref:aldehyde dehydrogenase family protein n=1 Tax=Amycolatopsis sp. H20-H5 TaxID=3046309 RepID=UPI002DB93E55|nr:aldehyde dehydrogenase family protein [Amycolatopsis sp. H20-H5]MEC3979061.1 aldehyde dehydrogenase family protein [Amycolatopsis sp. H20-H5]
MNRPQWTRERTYIGGAWVETRGDICEVEDPATEKVIGRVRQATQADATQAVDAARAAAPAWGSTTPAYRIAALRALSTALRERGDLLVDTLVGEVGTPVSLARSSHLGQALTVLDSYAELLETFAFEDYLANTRVLRESAGVVAAITPWNYPLYQLIAKVAPALAAGCPVVVKPAELTPLSAFIVADAAEAIGLPPGVFNLVPGPGGEVGEVLATHPGVDVVSFTGSTRVGRRVAALAADTVKRVCLELGGKSASLMLPGADVERAVSATVANVMVNSGQTCAAWTRLLVPRSELDQSLAVAEAAASRQVVGDPRHEATELGPVISAAQRRSVLNYIEQAVAEGATLVEGGTERPRGLTVGHYVRPTVLTGVSPQSRIAQEEVFGPVLVVLPYEDVGDAVDLANATPYGLAGSVWGPDDERAFSVARRLRTGRVDVNGAAWNPSAPFGGYKQSGNGRELGSWGIEEFLETKAVQMPYAASGSR